MVNVEKDRSVDLDALAAQIHTWNAKWWHDLEGNPIERDVGTMLMLMISEAAEAMEGRRKSKPGQPLMDDKLPHREMAEVELGDIQIRALDVLGSGKYRGSEYSNESITRQVDYELSMHTYYRTMKDMQDGDRLMLICQIICSARSNYDYGHTLFRSLCRVLAAVEVLADLWGYDLYGAVNEKNAYNLTRHDHSVEGRKAEGGKAW